MRSNTSSFRCLVVEDDKFKLDSVLAFLKEELGDGADIVVCEALSTAVVALANGRFDIVIIDMSIPSHPTLAGAGSPYPFPSGGLDVLFEIDAQGHQCKTVILTQYPEIEIDGILVPVGEAAAAIAEKFEINVDGCIQYFDDSQSWKHEIKKAIDTP